jgi:polar amino acid transport system substrate-binding protein
MPQYRRNRPQAILAALAICLAGAANAQQKAGPACPARPITLGVFEFGNFYRAGGGLDKDVADQMAARSGCKIELRTMLRGQIWRELQAGNLDMTLSAVATPERTTFAWAAPYLWIKNKVILRKDVDAKVHSIGDFIAASNLRVGVARGHYIGKSYGEFVAQLRNIARVEETGSTEQLFSMFKAGRFQAIVGTQLVYSSYLKEDQARVEDWDPAGPRYAVNLLISKKNFSQDESKHWADLMKTMVRDGTMLRLLERYTPSDDAAKMLSP